MTHLREKCEIDLKLIYSDGVAESILGLRMLIPDTDRN
jgi:hypothetical protein